MNEFLNEVDNMYKNVNVNEYSPLVLAYIGDAVFEIFVRTMVCKKSNAPVNSLHKKSREYVKASAQAEMFQKIKQYLSEDEYLVLKRGRNAKSFTKAKNASVIDYRHATGLEALFGYLYLKGENKRLTEIFELCIS